MHLSASYSEYLQYVFKLFKLLVRLTFVIKIFTKTELNTNIKIIFK